MEGRTLILPEALDRASAVEVRDAAVQLLSSGPGRVVLDLARVKRADAFGIAGILEIHREATRRGAGLLLVNVPELVRNLFVLLRVDRVQALEEAPQRRESSLERMGGFVIDAYEGAVQQAVLNLDCLYLSFIAPFRGRGPRSDLFLHQLHEIGTRSVGIVTLITFLIGTIMALQAAYVLRLFGANILVANLVGVSMTRELGPLMAAIVIAARCGSSMAAEIGTMVVTEEVDAIKVMALEPKRFLVAPRFAAMLVALPCLAILADVAGIAGGFAVAVLGLDIGVGTYWQQTVDALYVKDIMSGLVKSFIFANVIAVVACHRGLTLRGGPEEVGRATTRSVVASIVIVILADFLFTSLFFVLD